MAKLVTYKPTKPDSAAGKPAVVKALGQHTRAINQVGLVSNSIGKIAEEMRSIAGATIAFQKYQEKKKKKHSKNFITQEEQLVNEVVDYLLGISVG